jgi:FtsZ-binding cell division protein ZapB
MEHDAFDVLEEKVRKAAEALKRLRSQNEELRRTAQAPLGPRR